MLQEICRPFVDLKEREILSYEYKVCNIATAITAVIRCEGLKLEHLEVCSEILEFLTETQEEITRRDHAANRLGVVCQS